MNSQMKRLQQQQRKINGNRNAHAKAYAPVKGSGSIGGGAAAVMLGGLGAGATYMAMRAKPLNLLLTALRMLKRWENYSNVRSWAV